MPAAVDSVPLYEEYPSRGDLRALMAEYPLPVVVPGTLETASLTPEGTIRQAAVVLDALSAALEGDDTKALKEVFFSHQAYFKDALALTFHLRTFTTPGVIALALLELQKLRGLAGTFKLESAQFIPASPDLHFIDARFSFKTTTPAATSSGRLLLLPVKADGNVAIQWKIWVLSTQLENLDVHPEDEALLQGPAKKLDGIDRIETDVFIIGGGNSAVALAARLKALGVESVLAERNAHPGDNWALRYDCMKFHIPTSFCNLPYMPYGPELQSPHLLTKAELAEHIRKYVASFNLNVINSAKIKLTVYDQAAKQWTINFETPAGPRTAISKHLVQATGIGSQKLYIPPIAGRNLYRGISVHSVDFKSGNKLKELGAKSVLVIGSANTAFDVMEDCHLAELQTTLNVRSPTYVIPLNYLCDKLSLGIYDDGVEAADRFILTLPSPIESQLSQSVFRLLASREPERYKALATAGFPVINSANPKAVLMSHLLERAGGHYVDVGTTKLIEDGKVGVKANVEPVAYTETGLQFSDGSTLDADAIVWCTGFADKDARYTVADILGGETEVATQGLLGPKEIAARVDATWGLDAEGEVRGMWKRHLRQENYWVMGGYTQLHRWHSRNLALQIKADLAGVLPPAYRSTPMSRDKGEGSRSIVRGALL
ncbi:unnamed protein product [Clonostachys solani]|uniref:FAD/NAD(P)-binding domain-containing protein n=1 Tax=Clonostachys solani TaxID=160281 RepID=A0A9N9Z7Z7_9HYPO|nr:unnamed protein product [Clonostachys solani]